MVASEILISIRLISRVVIILFFTFLESPLRTKAILSFALQKTPRLGFSLKSKSSRWDIFYTLLIFIKLELKCFIFEISDILNIMISKQVSELYKFNPRNNSLIPSCFD